MLCVLCWVILNVAWRDTLRKTSQYCDVLKDETMRTDVFNQSINHD